MLEKISSKEALVGVIGLGYVGLPLSLAVVSSGYSVCGYDIDESKPIAIGKRQSYLHHVPSSDIENACSTGRFSAVSDFSTLDVPDIIVICVPTPLKMRYEPNLTYVIKTVEDIAACLRPGQLVILESTTYPGTLDEVVRPILEARGFTAGEDLFLAFSPEREDPGNQRYSTTSIPKIVGADDPASSSAAAAFYRNVVDTVVSVSNSKVAEATKLTENIFRSVNIALVNELKTIFEPMGIDIWEVIDAAKTKPFGFMPFYPGPGLGGHCIPIDPFYLAWKARHYDIRTRFIELAGEINSAMPQRVVDKLSLTLDERQCKGLRGSTILVLGAAYKKNVGDTRESSALQIMDILEARGARVAYYDPFVPEIPTTREHPALIGRRSVDWKEDLAADYDAVLIVTDHENVDYQAILRYAKLVVDTRNACRNGGANGDNLVLA